MFSHGLRVTVLVRWGFMGKVYLVACSSSVVGDDVDILVLFVGCLIAQSWFLVAFSCSIFCVIRSVARPVVAFSVLKAHHYIRLKGEVVNRIDLRYIEAQPTMKTLHMLQMRTLDARDCIADIKRVSLCAVSAKIHWPTRFAMYTNGDISRGAVGHDGCP